MKLYIVFWLRFRGNQFLEPNEFGIQESVHWMSRNSEEKSIRAEFWFQKHLIKTILIVKENTEVLQCSNRSREFKKNCLEYDNKIIYYHNHMWGSDTLR